MRTRVMGAFLALLALSTVFTTPVAAAPPHMVPLQTVGDILSNMVSDLANWAIYLGTIFLIVGGIFYGAGRKSGERSERGIGFFIGGIVCILLGAGHDIITNTVQDWVPGIIALL